jgi:membrane fusion protein, copper/silver efflux system
MKIQQDGQAMAQDPGPALKDDLVPQQEQPSNHPHEPMPEGEEAPPMAQDLGPALKDESVPQQEHPSDHHHEAMPEGEEAPPPGTRIMAIVRWCLILGMSLFALGVVAHSIGILNRVSFGLLGNGSKAAGQLYQCPMHPTYTSDKPGECPICGMTLVPVKAGKAPSGTPPKEHAQPPAPGHEGHAAPAADGASASAVPADTMASAGHEEHQVPGLVSVQIPPERTQLIGVQTGTVALRPLGQTFDLVGYVVPDETRLAHIHTRLSGWLQKLYVDETGQKVKKGDQLFTLFSRELYQAEREFLLTRKAGGSTVAQGTMAEVASAAKRRLELLDVPGDEIDRLEKSGQPQEALLFRSPLTGYVLEKGALEGKFVTPGDELYTVADLSRIWVLAEVYEQHISRVEVGQKANLSVEAMAGKSFEGRVAFLYPTLSQRTRTLRVRLEFDNPGLELKPGMYGKVQVQVRPREVLSVPEEAVVDAGHHQYAFVALEDGRFEPRLLKIGLRADDLVEIVSGLSEGEKVVTSAGFFIDSESRLAAAVAGLGAAAVNPHAGHGQ